MNWPEKLKHSMSKGLIPTPRLGASMDLAAALKMRNTFVHFSLISTLVLEKDTILKPMRFSPFIPSQRK